MIVFIILLAVFLFIVFFTVAVRLAIVKKPNKEFLLNIKFWFFKYEIDIKKLLKKDRVREKAAFEIKFDSVVIKYLLSKTRFKISELNLYAGFDDAALLAIFCGFVNALLYSAVALAKNVSIENTSNIAITPVFNKNYFELKFECIIKIKLRNIIIGYIFKKRK